MNRKIAVGLKYGLGLLVVAMIAAIYFEVKNPADLRQFRRTDKPFAINLKNTPSRKGLEELRASGSARLNLPYLKNALADVTGPIYVVDLLEVPHYFIEGLPVRWYGYKKPSDLLPNTTKLPKLTEIRYILRRFLRTGKLTHNRQDMQTEKEMIEQAGYHYVDASYTRGDIPTNERADQIIKFLTSLPSNSWVHFHCSAGKGRTTVVMTMYDIIKNGKELPLETIVERQRLLKGVDLFDTEVWANGSYTKEALENRKNFIVVFYEYVNDPKGLGVSSWNDWLKAKGLGTGRFIAFNFLY